MRNFPSQAAAEMLAHLFSHGRWTQDEVQDALGKKFWRQSLGGLLELAPRPYDAELIRKIDLYAWLLGRADELHLALLNMQAGLQTTEDEERIEHLGREVDDAYRRALDHLEMIECWSPEGVSQYMDRPTDPEVVNVFEVSATGVPRPYSMLTVHTISPEVVPDLAVKCVQQMAAVEALQRVVEETPISRISCYLA